MEQTSTALHHREQQLEKYSELEADLPRSDDPKLAVSGIGWLYDLLPAASRARPVDTSGIQELHRCLAVLGSSQES